MGVDLTGQLTNEVGGAIFAYCVGVLVPGDYLCFTGSIKVDLIMDPHFAITALSGH